MACPPAPGLAELRRSAAVFGGFGAVDDSWLALVDLVRPALDLRRDDHRMALHRWLNTWSCRIPYPRDGEVDLLGAGLGGWWAAWADALPTGGLADLTDERIDRLARGYGELAGIVVRTGRGGRSLGPTAAGKALYAMAPRAIMPWDAAIATRMYGARDDAAFGAHLRLGRQWARDLLAVTGLDEAAVPGLVGRPTVSLAKVLDEYLYVTITYAAQHA